MISSSLRVAFSSILKSLSKSYSSKNISVINIAPGPFKTRRVKQLIGDHKDLKKYEKLLPTKKIGEPKEPRNYAQTKGGIVTTVGFAFFMPLLGLSLVLYMILDLIYSSLPFRGLPYKLPKESY